jgi:catechol 2,3-dioxygenase-like lactoylglutathione lyase family enzyme
VLTAIHTLIYSDDADATRAFLRDVVGLPCVEDADSEPGWLIFKTGPSELGVHPTSGTHEGGDYSYPRHQSIAFVCDDVEATVAELARRGARFSGEIEDLGFGRGIMLQLPAADDVLLYEPQHPTAFDL